MPIPAFAPVERPSEELSSSWTGELGDDVGTLVIVTTWAVDVAVGDDEAVVVAAVLVVV